MNIEKVNALSQKTISQPEAFYNHFKAKKKTGESIPDVIVRLLDQKKRHQKPSIPSFFGALGENNEEWDKIGEGIYENRLCTKEREEIKLMNE